MRLIATLILASLLAPRGFAAESMPANHSRVHIVFATDIPQSAPQGRGMGGIGFSVPMTRIGNAMLPTNAIKLVHITIDDEFVGHALLGSMDLEPVFVLPEGLRNFTFTMDGVDPIKAKLTVLGTGSTQYLVVRLPAGSHPMDNFVPDANGSIVSESEE